MVLSELSAKDVVNNEDGIKLGRIVDVEIDVASGKIQNITIDRSFRFASIFSTKNQTVIPWSRIIKIGNDVIIVDQTRL